ncbi:MAG: leucine-rich repeat protein [Alistipes sp.]|nr:leucine-rich repeat protein [Alistipes sp.]
MKHTLTLLCALMSFVAAVAQTQHSIVIDEQSFKAVQVDARTGVGIDKIPHDNSNRPCARIKMHINRMTRAEIDGLRVYPVGGSVVVMKQTVAAEGNGLIIELTAKEPTRFYLHHDKYGDSNEVSLNLEGDKEYRLSAQLNIAYPIVVNSNVKGAEVYVDGVYKGMTNDSYTLTINDILPGEHRVMVQHGNTKNEQQIDVSAENIYFRIEVSAATTHPQYVVFKVAPYNAVVLINGKNYVPDGEGVVTLTLYNGSYNYQVLADEYYPQNGTFVVSGEKVVMSVDLKPAHGWLSVGDSGVLKGASIYVDDKHIGKTPISKYKLASGEHRVMVVKEMYQTLKSTITISDGENFNYTPTLSADFATVTFDAGAECDIYVNDVLKGKSPWTGELATGAYIVEARKEGHRSTTLSQSISATPAKQSYKLDAPSPIMGSINVVSSPALGEVYVDGKFVGETPLMHNLLIGEHEITIKREGYVAIKQNVTIVESKVSDMIVELQKGVSTQNSSVKNSAATPNNVIEYVSRDGKIDITDAINKFGASVISHTWDKTTGRGVITFNKDVTTIGDDAFSNCKSLTSVTIPDSVMTIGKWAFFYCENLTSVTIPDSVTTIGGRAFAYCHSLTSVTIPASVTAIGGRAFAYCYSLTSVTIPTSVTAIGDYAFYNCTSLTSITIPDSVMTIGTWAFSYCKSLTSVTIPNSVTTIGIGVFYDCINLTSVYCKAITPPVSSISVFGGNGSGRKIYVPMQSVKQYKKADGWNKYKKHIVGYNFK